MNVNSYDKLLWILYWDVCGSYPRESLKIFSSIQMMDSFAL